MSTLVAAPTTYRQGMDAPTWEGWLSMPTAEEKLDRVLAQITDLRVDVAAMRGDLHSNLAATADHETRMRTVEAVIAAAGATAAELAAWRSDVESRMRPLEADRWRRAGWSAAIGLLSAVPSSLIVYAVTHH